MNTNDLDLARRVAQGDRNANEILVVNHYEGVVRFLTLLSRDEEQARELAQETFVRARLKAGAFRGDSTLRAWLHGIAWREFLKANRRITRAKSREMPFEAQVYRISTEAVALWDAISSLSDTIKSAYVLHEVIGWTMLETAQILGVPEGTVTSRVFRARQRLRQYLSPDEFETTPVVQEA